MKRILQEYILKNKKNFIIITIFLLIGVIAGIVMVNLLSSNIKLELDQYINSVLSSIKAANSFNRLEMLRYKY